MHFLATLTARSGIRPLLCSRAVSTQAIQYGEHGAPSNVLSLKTVELASVSPSDISVEVLAAPINPADINMIEGVYPIKPPLPAVGGNECVGVVSEVGTGVQDFQPGDWVIPATAGLGTWTKQIVAPSKMFTRVPNDIPVEAAACLSVNPCTAYRMLADFVDCQEGDVIVQNGANSGVGVMVVQMAAARGVKTINIVRERPGIDSVIENLKGLGGTIVVTDRFAASREMKDIVKEMGKPKLALNCTGGPAATEAARMLGQGGVMVTYGGMSRKPVTVPTGPFIFNDIELRGFWMTRWTKENPVAEREKMIADIAGLIRDGRLRIDVETIHMEDFQSAFEKGRGKVLMKM